MKKPGDIIIESRITNLINLIFGFLFGIFQVTFLHIQLWIAIPIFIIVMTIFEIRGIFSDIKKLEM